jgi:cystathionine beta-lyase/cystathionine gamma-synthase
MQKEAVNDIRNDLIEILYLINDNIRKLKRFLADIRKAKTHISGPTYQQTVISAECLLDTYVHQKNYTSRTITATDTMSPSATLLSRSEEAVQSLRDFLRTFQIQTAALITCTDWQSPSFSHTIHSQAGRQTNTIYATINDYKRDQHWDTHAYEQAFLKEYIDAFIKFPIQVCTTSSGMAAFTTILCYLLLEQKAKGPVLIGSSVYFENKALLRSAFGDRVIEVDENDTGGIIETIKTRRPCLIVFDSLANASTIAVPDLKKIIHFLVSFVRQDTYLVIDNTGLATQFQPFPLLAGIRTKLRVIMFESLNKYHEFGMDRVTGGIFWSSGGDTGKLFDYRIHLGTIMPDSAAVSLPTPNRELLDKRLMRITRNTSLIASTLQEWIDLHPHSPFASVIFPGLPNHPMYARTQSAPFHGGYCTIQFKPRYQKISVYKRFVKTVIRQAKNERADIVTGTSFGLNSTRIYLTALRSSPTTPFVRIAVGTEHRIAIEKISRVLTASLSQMK